MSIVRVVKDPRVKGAPEGLLDGPFVALVNKFDEASVKEFRETFQKALSAGQPFVPVLIDSYGGECYSLLAMIDVVLSCPVPVYTVASGKAMSCGGVLLGMGERRFVGPNATVLLHEVSSGQFGKVGDLEVGSEETRRLNDHLFRLLARRVGWGDQDYFLKLLHDRGHTEIYLTPRQSLKHKLATDLYLPRVVAEVKVDYRLEGSQRGKV